MSRRGGATVSRSIEARSSGWFIDATVETGLDFTHVNGMTGEFYYPEIIAPGVALFDYDNDEDLDVFLVQGQPLGPGKVSTPLRSRLFRNDLTFEPDGTRIVRFVDVTDMSGIRTTAYGMGASVGDYNNDGWVDLYVTALGRNQLYRNQGDGTFRELAEHAGVDDSGWSVSAAFLDFDRDGWLDLYVGHYLNWDRDASPPCFAASGEAGVLRAAGAFCPAEPAVPQRPRRNVYQRYRGRWNGRAVWSRTWRHDRGLQRRRLGRFTLPMMVTRTSFGSTSATARSKT